MARILSPCSYVHYYLCSSPLDWRTSYQPGPLGSCTQTPRFAAYPVDLRDDEGGEEEEETKEDVEKDSAHVVCLPLRLS